MDLFREKHTPQTECGPSQKVRKALTLILSDLNINSHMGLVSTALVSARL